LTKDISEWFETAQEKSDRVDALLRHLVNQQNLESLESGMPGERMTLDEIADFCGVDRNVIYRTERTAIQKIREKFSKNDL
jgi:DNA-directed RNA polymerase sigma subunit (sigma70/sigma32)